MYSVPTATFFSDEPLLLRAGPQALPLPTTVPRIYSRLRFGASPTQWANLRTEELPLNESVFAIEYEHMDSDREAGVWLIVASAIVHVGAAVLTNLGGGSLSRESNNWMVGLGTGLGLLAVTGYVFGIYYACLADRVVAHPR